MLLFALFFNERSVLKGFAVKRSMVLALFYVVAIQSVPIVTGCGH
jgi:hypothetical protein